MTKRLGFLSSQKNCNPAIRGLEGLEPRLLYSGGSTASTQAEGAVSSTSVDIPLVPDLAAFDHSIEIQSLALPAGLPEAFSVEVAIDGKMQLLHLNKISVFGENTRFLVDDGSGNLTAIDNLVDGAYSGGVSGHPEVIINAWLDKEGLRASVDGLYGESFLIEPVGNSYRLHEVVLDEPDALHDHEHEHEAVLNGADANGVSDSDDAVAASTAGASSSIPEVAVAEAESSSSATLPPSRVMNVYEFEVGVEIGSAAFLNNYGGSLSAAQAEAAKIPANLDRRYLHATGIKHRLGTVIIRTSTATDPLAGKVVNGNDTSGLSDFRNYWNSNPQEVGTTHDLAVYHVRGAPSGLAYVNQVGTGSRYALTASNGPSSWADGTLVHEFGHTWSLPHVGDGQNSGMFYESKPRSNGNSAGGDDVFVSVMHGGGSHNIGRLATDEASRVYSVRQGKLGFGDLVAAPGEIKPFGHRDSAVAFGDPIVIDVIANDYDVNNDVLNVQLRDTVSQQGGTIGLSMGTGPGGRNEIVYTPPAGVNGQDFFHYTVVDSTGKTDWGAVYVKNSGPVVIDTSVAQFDYHVGTGDDPINNGWGVITPGTTGDIFWSGEVDAKHEVQNGSINRGYVFSGEQRTLRHKVANGTWKVVMNFGSLGIARDNVFVSAEGVTLDGDLDSSAGAFNPIDGIVTVTDGWLDLVIDDLGGSDPHWALNRLSLTLMPEAVYQFDFGSNSSGAYSGAEAAADLSSAHTVWNSVTRNDGNLETVLDSQGVASDVTLKAREAADSGAFDFAVAPSGLEDTRHSFAGFYGTELMTDVMFTRADDDLGVQVNGLEPGEYMVYVMLREPSASDRTYSVDIGTGPGNAPALGDFGLGNTTALPATAPSGWARNQNYYAKTVAVGSSSDSLYVLIDSTNSQFVSLQGLQIVQLTASPPQAAAVIQSTVFYDDSAFDGTSDNDAVDTSKQGLEPGEAATFENYTNYDKGLNGVVVDIRGLASQSLTAADFGLRIKQGSSNSWSVAPTPTITVLPGQGLGGADRVMLAFDSPQMKNVWLEVTTKATDNTGLTEDDVFYIGNAVADTGNSTEDTAVTSRDLYSVYTNRTDTAGVGNVYDLNKDGAVDNADVTIARGAVNTVVTDVDLLVPASGDLFTLTLASFAGPIAPASLMVGMPMKVDSLSFAAPAATSADVYTGLTHTVSSPVSNPVFEASSASDLEDRLAELAEANAGRANEALN